MAIDIDILQPIAFESNPLQRTPHIVEPEVDDPRRIVVAHIVVAGHEIRIIGARPDVARLLGATTARGGIEHFRELAVIRQPLSHRRHRCAPRGGRRGTQDLTMRAVAEVVAVARVAIAVLQRVGVRGFRIALSRQDAGDVHLERNDRDMSIGDGPDAQRAAGAGRE